ncbi:MAG: hypothetical protein JNM66_07175 [Bryobacterales bacterium]|nr:hypothetical protein [Bryobacterales bacterium]
MNLVERCQNSSNDWQEILHLIGSRSNDQHRYASLEGILLLRETLVHSEKNLVTGNLGLLEKLSVLKALEPRPLRGMHFVPRQMVPEIYRQTLIQQNLHAIFANNDSFASSSAWIAFSRDTVGNWRKNSPSV